MRARILTLLSSLVMVSCTSANDKGEEDEVDLVELGAADSLTNPTFHPEFNWNQEFDASLQEGTRYHLWRFQLTDSATVKLQTLPRSERETDTVLVLYRDLDGRVDREIVRNDDALHQGTRLSEVRRDLTAGRYTVLVRGYNRRTRGAFALRGECSGAGCGDPQAKTTFEAGESIAVIGAGVSGLAIVRSLLEKGTSPSSITVYERDAVAGGKVLSVDVDGRAYELGAAVIVPGRYAAIEERLAHHGMTARNLVNPDSRGYSMNVADTEDGMNEPPSPEVSAMIQAQVGSWLSTLYPTFGNITEPKGFSDFPEFLETPWPDYHAANNLQLFNAALGTVLGGSGYVRVANHPPVAAQVARFLQPSTVTGLLRQGVQAVDGGYQTLWKREAEELEEMGVRFEYERAVTSITRTINGPVLSFANRQRLVDHVFFTPNLQLLPTLLSNVTDDERQAYGRLVSYEYHSYLMRVSGMPEPLRRLGAYGVHPYMSAGVANHPVLLVKFFADTDVYCVYAYGDGVPESQIRTNIESDFAAIGAHVDATVEHRTWTYFPHVSSDLSGFFNGVDAYQGAGGIWLSGEALSFGLTAEVYDQGKAFAALFTENAL